MKDTINLTSTSNRPLSQHKASAPWATVLYNPPAAAGFRPENSRHRLFQNLMVTVPNQGDKAGIVRSVDADGRLRIELGTLNATQHMDLVNGETTVLVRTEFVEPSILCIDVEDVWTVTLSGLLVTYYCNKLLQPNLSDIWYEHNF